MKGAMTSVGVYLKKGEKAVYGLLSITLDEVEVMPT
jgi:hypothetical protein